MNTDYKYINQLIELSNDLNANIGEMERHMQSFPLDNDVREKMSGILSNLSDNSPEHTLYQYQDKVHDLWIDLLTKAIQCLRYFDEREPFLENHAKHPLAYGIADLDAYYIKYTEFEKVMYGGVPYYRDHVIHVFRVWILGCVVLLRNNHEYLNQITIDKACELNNYEKLSIWTIIGLTHDLGYPLEKASQIVDKTKNMMTAFVSNPIVSMDLSFSGVQNSMNDFILRMMSSKMKGIKIQNNIPSAYVARLQPKYYFKFQKSLEHNMHGILSAIIIYKLLLYFLESDYTINEDYEFNKDDVKQFYIRRDILRAIASHTCPDVYQMDKNLFSFLLIACDEAQTWGRKGIAELYVNKNTQYEFKDIEILQNNEMWKVSDKYDAVGDDKDAMNILEAFKHQCLNYVSIFRDGQDTNRRNFDFVWEMFLNVKRSEFKVIFEAKRNENIRIILMNQQNRALSESNETVMHFDKLFNDKSNLRKEENYHEWSFSKAKI